MEIPCLSISIFLFFRNAHIFFQGQHRRAEGQGYYTRWGNPSLFACCHATHVYSIGILRLKYSCFWGMRRRLHEVQGKDGVTSPFDPFIRKKALGLRTLTGFQKHVVTEPGSQEVCYIQNRRYCILRNIKLLFRLTMNWIRSSWTRTGKRNSFTAFNHIFQSWS